MPARLAGAVVALGLLVSLGQSLAQDGADIARGRYLVTIMDCGACHTEGTLLGRPDLAHPLAGSSIGREVAGLGVFWPPNLTPDRATGLGSWTDQDIVTALRTGARPDGRILVRSMPWRVYAHLTDADAFAIAHYLQSLPPVAATVRPPTGLGTPASTPVATVVMPSDGSIPR